MNLRINNQIRTKEVRLLGVNGEQLGIVPLYKALENAQKANLDLVEVAATAKPCVCKILDYGKYKYDLEKKESVAKRKQKIVELREIRLRPKIDEHDLETKIKQIKKFMAEGDKVKIVIVYKGREISHAHLGWKVLETVVNDLQGLVQIEQQPKLEGSRMFTILAPLKNQTLKKNLPQHKEATKKLES